MALRGSDERAVPPRARIARVTAQPRRLRIGFVSSHPVPYHVPTYRALAERDDVELEVLFMHDHGVGETFDAGFGRTVRFDVPLLEGYPHRFLRNISPVPALTSAGMINPELPVAVARGRYDAVVLHGYTLVSTLAALLAPRSRRTRVLLRGESTLLHERSFLIRATKHVLLRALFTRVDHFLSIGTKSAEYFQAYGADPDRITPAPYTVDNAWFEERSAAARRDPAAVRRKLGLPTDRVLFLFCSKVVAHKRPLDVLSAFLRARDAAPCGLVYVGEGEQLAEVRRQVDCAGAQDDVHFLGFRNQTELPEIYGACDVFVQASKREPWGMVVNEAMASGMAVVASDQVGSAYDLVGDNGAMFRAGDVDGLAVLLRRWAGARNDVDRMKAASLRRIREWTARDSAEGVVRGVRAALAYPAGHAPDPGALRA
jgi:glycosyltransferase involved in cell wall biosynthesis